LNRGGGGAAANAPGAGDSPFPETADIETASDDYARRFAGRVGEYFLEIQARATLDLLSPWPGARLLEVGGGHAQIAPSLVRRKHPLTVTGSDESCRSRLDRLLTPGGFQFIRCDMLRLPFRDREFDVVLAFRLLPHVERWKDLIREMCRVASAAVIVDYPEVMSFNAVQRLFFGWKKAIERNTRPFRCFRRRELSGEFAAHGFSSPEFRPELFFPMVLHRAAGSAGFSRAAEAPARALGLTALFGSPVVLRVVRKP
jgi:methyltransferase family protein